MSEFLRFVDDLRKHFPVHVEIYCSKIMPRRWEKYLKGVE